MAPLSHHAPYFLCCVPGATKIIPTDAQITQACRQGLHSLSSLNTTWDIIKLKIIFINTYWFFMVFFQLNSFS